MDNVSTSQVEEEDAVRVETIFLIFLLRLERIKQKQKKTNKNIGLSLVKFVF